ncbi:hypothetical protein C7212DRAFT_361661 [Tuber magnatum]|uniref:Uncharacterized protein n=1 Tax=Tuber magnatum TaxID=42249 RepID=A0A317SW39_9PEZI|nr:hypothetical protein C7212DRAFT_361661 [Tuber magnatum]
MATQILKTIKEEQKLTTADIGVVFRIKKAFEDFGRYCWIKLSEYKKLAVSWMRKEFNLWVYDHLLTLEAIEAITDALIIHDHFLGEFSGAVKVPDLAYSPCINRIRRAFPTVVLEPGWTESQEQLLHDLQLWQERRPGAVKFVILFKLYRSRLRNRIKAALTIFRYVAGHVPAMSFYNSRWAKPGNTARTDVYQFGNLLISSGLVMYDDVKWISFHSGYDFGYLVKIMSCLPLPMEESGLQDIVEEMGVPEQVWGLNGSGISPPNINGVGTVVYNSGVPVPSTPTTDRNGQNPANPGNTTPSQQQQQQNDQPGTPSQYNLQYGKMGGM